MRVALVFLIAYLVWRFRPRRPDPPDEDITYAGGAG